MRISMDGLAAFERALHRYAEALGEAFAKGSEDAAEMFLSNNDVYVKYETGALRESGVYYQEYEGFETQTIIGYGARIDSLFFREGRSQPQDPETYAYYQHDEQPNALYPGTHFMWMDEGLAMFESIMVGLIVEEMQRV